MRALFLLLLLANVLFFAWTRWIAVPTAATTAGTANPTRAAAPIRLRQELEPAADLPPSPVGTSSSEIPVAAVCVSVGPFLEQAAAESTASRLARLGFTSRLRASTDEVRVGLWVRVTDLATQEDATNALAALQAAGFTDAYVVGGDEAPGNTVSLGVFADRGRAEEVSELVRRAGFVPETSDRLRTMDVFWLDIDRQANGGLPTLESLGTGTSTGLPLEIRACPASGPTPGAGPAG